MNLTLLLILACFQALGQCGRSKKRAGGERGVADSCSIFALTATSTLEQAIIVISKGVRIRVYCLWTKNDIAIFLCLFFTLILGHLKDGTPYKCTDSLTNFFYIF